MELQGLEEVCIISASKDYAQGLYFKEFMKWIGLSYFHYTFNEVNEKLNRQFEEKNNQFDFIVYINDQDAVWKRRFGQLAKKNISIQMESLWIYDSESKRAQINKKYLLELWTQLFEESDQSKPEFALVKNILEILSNIYCKYDLMRKLLNNKNSLFMSTSEMNTSPVYVKEMENHLEQWKVVINNLQTLRMGNLLSYNSGMEYVEYATGYCYRKVNELCDLMGKRRFYETSYILKGAETVYAYIDRFYMIESLKAKIASMDSEYKELAIPYIRNCTIACKVDACSSFHFYRLGKQHELNDRREQADKIYRISYQKNPLNFRALFKLAVDRINKKDFTGAKQYLSGIMSILQLIPDDHYYEHLYQLPCLELEYVCKCYILLGNIELYEYDSPVSAKFFYDKALEVHNSIEKNAFLVEMYPDIEERKFVKLYLEKRLSREAIQTKLNLAQKK